MSADLNIARIRRLEAEVAVRTVLYIPRDQGREWEYTKCQQRSAYDSGYECGWRGQQPGTPYTQPWMQRAYIAGYEAGRRDSERAILAHVERAR